MTSPSRRRSGTARPALAAFVLVLAALPAPVRADCTCRLAGAEVPLGETACLSPSGRPALYRCEMNLNITTWHRIGDVCPMASLSPPHSANGTPHHGAPDQPRLLR